MKPKGIVFLLSFVLFVYTGDISAGIEEEFNTFYGAFTGDDNSGLRNSFFGSQAGQSNMGGSGNTFVGYQSGILNTTGKLNTFIGDGAGTSNVDGERNIFIGNQAGLSNSSGTGNTFIGSEAGYNCNGNNNVFIGYLSGYGETGSNMLYIDNSDTSTPLIYGEFDNNLVEINGDFYVTGNTYMTSDARLKKDIQSIDSSLEKIKNIRGVKYAWKNEKNAHGKFNDRHHYGVIGQEVEEVLPEAVSKDREGTVKVAYSELIPVMIEAMKEQQSIIDEQKKEIEELKLIVKKILSSNYLGKQDIH